MTGRVLFAGAVVSLAVSACAASHPVFLDKATEDAATADAKAATGELGDLLASIEEDSCKTAAPDPAKACAAERFLPFAVRYQRRWRDDVDPAEDDGPPSALPRHGGRHRSPEDVAAREAALCRERCTHYEEMRWQPAVMDVQLACDDARATPSRDACASITTLAEIPPQVDRAPLVATCIARCDDYRAAVRQIEALERRPRPKNQAEKEACWKDCTPLLCNLGVDCRCFDLCAIVPPP